MDNTIKGKNNEIANRFLVNTKLFEIVSRDGEIDNKIRELLYWLDFDVNINYIDDGIKNNTLLHIAVIRGEIEIVKLLLQRGASTTERNADKKTALDLAQSLHIPNKEGIIDLIQTFNRGRSVQSVDSSEQPSGSKKLLDKSLWRNYKHTTGKHSKQSLCMEKFNTGSLYTKRSGTSGIGGQLYETKLLSLFLLRVLNDTDINRFYLGTNIDGIGAFDDIVLKYEVQGINKPRILFIQAKHKDDPEQNKITTQDLFKGYGDFCLHKYYESYIKIKNRFNNSNGDIIFNNDFTNVHCSFIIFTPAMENFKEKKKEIHDSDKFKFNIHTSDMGKVLQLNYCDQDVECLLESVLEIRTQQIGKTLMKFLFKENYNNILVDDLMKVYHVFLAQQVVEICPEAQPIHPYLTGKFRSTFFDSKNWLLRILKETIYKEFSLKYNTSSTDEIKSVMRGFSFKLPLNFGNINFIPGGNDKKIERRLNHICSKIKRMLDNVDSIGSSVIKIDNMIGPGLILQETDLEIYRLGGLVGNLFILDANTLTLKFNESVESLPPLVIKIFERLKNEFPEGKDFTKYRFHINYYKFPKLQLGRNMDEVRLVEDFFNSLIFYTNQACEDEVEKILKNEIDKYYGFNSIKGNLLSRMKGESIFLKVHDSIQKWWKNPLKSPYLDKTCNLYDEAKKELYSDSILHTLQFLFIKKLTGYGIQFRQFDCQFDILLEDDEGFINIVTRDIILTSIKLIQFMKQNATSTSYIFINLDFIISENCFDVVLSELREIKSRILFVVCENSNSYDKILNLIDSLQGLVIAVTKDELREQVLSNFNPRKYTQIFDQRNAFIDLVVESRKQILNETEVLFQGTSILLKTLIKNKLDVIDSVSLNAILNKQVINIGRKFTKAKYEELEDCYVVRSMWRFITLKMRPDDKIIIINVTENPEIIPNDNTDIIVISDKIEGFLKCSEKYKDKNCHWFIKDNGKFIWKKTVGSLGIIADNVNKEFCKSYKCNPKTLLDLHEKVVIICAGPGMGKSTLMTYLSIQTKKRYPTIWIMRLNCLDYKNLFSYWQENNIAINLKEVIKFLYMANNLLIVKEKNIKRNFCDIFRYNFDIIIAPEGDLSIDIKDPEFVGLPYLEVGLFNHLYNNGNIAIVFDGFDEISPDYINEVLELLVVLKDSKVCRLWITTRPYNILPYLEQKMGTFAFTLDKLSTKDQHDLLEMLWGKALGEQKNDRLNLYVRNFFSSISRVLYDQQQEFTSVPLHIYMIADIYQHFFKDYYDPSISSLSKTYMENIQALNSLTLYERFVKKKFYEIRFGEKKPYIYDKDPDLKKMLEMERMEFVEVHKKLSAYAIFDRKIVGLFSKQVTKDIHEILEKVKLGEERTGIIVRVLDNEPIFVHLSFAEYFATEYLCDRLKAEECSLDVWIYLFDNIFVSDKRLVRQFFNHKLLADQNLFNLSTTFKYKQEITTVLFKQRDLYSLHTALLEYSEENALFLLQCIKDAINTENLSDFLKYILERKKNSCTFCSIINGRFKNVLKFMLEHVKNIDKRRFVELFKCGDVPLFNALGLAISYCAFPEDRHILDDLLSSVEDIEMALELFTMPSNMGLLRNTIVHVLVMSRHNITVLLNYLVKFNNEQRMQIFTTPDSDGKLAAHRAGENGDHNFFAVLSDLLDRDQLKIICATNDSTGRTPIDYLKSMSKSIANHNKFQQIKDLLEDRP